MPADFDELLMSRAAQFGPSACVWEAGRALVVPRTYRRLPRFTKACRRFAQIGWPVTVRQSGGGLVPQGPGIVNLSLAYAVDGPPLSRTESVYRHLCALVAETLGDYGIVSHPQAVTGSFCDGRYNLAWTGADGIARKIVGTAQLWRRIAAPVNGGAAQGPADPRPGLPGIPAQADARHTPPIQIVLAHAVILAAVDTNAITRVANSFERAAGGTAHYDPDRIASLHAIAGKDSHDGCAFTRDIIESLEKHVATAPIP